MKLKHVSLIPFIRHAIQVIVFLLFPELFITVLHALGDVITALANGEFSFYTLSAQLITIAVVFIMTAIWGRFFCGYLCSFGTLQEACFWISKKFFYKKNVVPDSIDHILQYLKYLIFIFIVVALWIMALPFDASLSPWGIFGILISGNFSIMVSAVHTMGFLFLLLILVGSFFVERFFCRYLCPLGAVFTIISGKRCYKIRRHKSTCINCRLCEKKCSMGISILKRDSISSGKCIDCMKCTTICPKESLSASPAPAAVGTVAAITMCGLIQIGKLTVADEITTVEIESFEKSETGNYIDGVYTGVGVGFRGNTEVQVTVENGYITDITVLSYEDNTEFFQKAQTSILNQILSEQSIDVQNVSGATFSSNSIIDAVADALGIKKQAETDYSVQASDKQGESDSGQIAESDQASSDSEKDDSSTQEFSSLRDGTYQGQGEGFRGTTSVSVTVESGKITDITVLSYEDDESFFARAEDVIIDEVINAQSLDVACVSGATFSSNGILEAVANALNIEFNNPNQNSSRESGHGKGKFGKTGH